MRPARAEAPSPPEVTTRRDGGREVTMGREGPGGPGPDEDELHALVDDELPADRRRAVVDRLAACPEAAGRAVAFARQRAVLAALGRLPLEGPAGDRLARLEREL